LKEVVLDAVAELALGIHERLLVRFRDWLDRLLDREPSQLSKLQRAGRLLLATVVSTACLSPFI
jgi:hypothetical protein